MVPDTPAAISNQWDATTRNDADDSGPVQNMECDMEVGEWRGGAGREQGLRIDDDDVYLIHFNTTVESDA